MKSLLYNTSTSKNNTCELIHDNGIPITNKLAIANKFNQHFINKIHNQISSQSIDDEDFHALHAYEQYDINSNFENPQCTEDEISLIMDNLSSSKATDVYGLSNNFLKMHKKTCFDAK